MAHRLPYLLLIFFLVINIQSAKCQQFKITTSAGAQGNLQLKINSLHNNATPGIVPPPSITYQTPQNYVVNSPIIPLTPNNTGGPVPQGIYGQTTLFSGSTSLPYYYHIVTGVAVAADGSVYSADWFDNKIRAVGPNGGNPTIVAGNYSLVFSNGQGTAASFNYPDALLFDAAGNLYISDQGNNMIRKMTPSGLVSTFAGNGAAGKTNGPANVATFDTPRGLAIDKTGNIYVADQVNNLIRKISPAGVVSTYAGTGAAGKADGPALSATFDTPTAVEVDDNGNLYVSDANNNSIRKISATGVVTTWITGLDFPRELRIDGSGNMYVLEQNALKLTRISPDGTVSIFANSFAKPIGLAMDGKGFLYVGDASAIYKVSISGYTIDKALPSGLTFNQTTGVITGTPTATWPSTNYTITGYNGGGSSSTVVNIAVGLTAVKKPSIITLPLQQPGMLDASNNYDPKGTSTNNETLITYTSSDPSIAEVLPNGMIHVKAPGQTLITAYQLGNANYLDAVPVSQTLTIVEHLIVAMPNIVPKTVCDVDFPVNAITSQPKVPLTFTSSNAAVATIDNSGIIHITGQGTTTITVAQNGNPPLYVSATPVSRTLTVSQPITGDIQITASAVNPCQGTPVTFTATLSNGGTTVKYQWQLNSNNVGSNQATYTTSALANNDNVTCIYTNLDNSCVGQFPVKANAISMQVIKASHPSVSVASSANYVFAGTTITFTASLKDVDNPVTYNWQVNGISVGSNNATYSSNWLQNGDIVSCVITDGNACSVPATSNALTIDIVDRISIPNTFTPNGDGVNDTWNISGLISYANCKVNIFDRYGRSVYQSTGYSKPWDGMANGKTLPASTYYYLINIGDSKVPQQRLSGSVTVLR